MGKRAWSHCRESAVLVREEPEFSLPQGGLSLETLHDAGREDIDVQAMTLKGVKNSGQNGLAALIQRVDDGKTNLVLVHRAVEHHIRILEIRLEHDDIGVADGRRDGTVRHNPIWQ